jgi:pimeloyl-ACP methyl ester carboxylesterase
METVEVDGLQIAYERVGSGPALVLLHGYVGDGPSTWRRPPRERLTPADYIELGASIPSRSRPRARTPRVASMTASRNGSSGTPSTRQSR